MAQHSSFKKFTSSLLAVALAAQPISGLAVSATRGYTSVAAPTVEEYLQDYITTTSNRVLSIAQTADWQGLQIPGDRFVGGEEYRLQARVLDSGSVGGARFVSQTDDNNFAWLGNTAINSDTWTDIDATFVARGTGLDHVRLVGAAPGTFFADDIVVTRVADGTIVYSNDFQDGGTSFGGDGGTFANVVDPLQVSGDDNDTPVVPPSITSRYWALGEATTGSGTAVSLQDAGSSFTATPDGFIVSGLGTDGWRGVDFAGFDFFEGDRIVVYSDVPVSIQGMPSTSWWSNAPQATAVEGGGYRNEYTLSLSDAQNFTGVRINQDQAATVHPEFTITSLHVYREEDATPPPVLSIPAIELPLLTPQEEERYLGDYVLMVTRTATPQHEGFGLTSRAAIEELLSADGRYAIEMDIFTPRSAAGMGFMVQTHSSWRHMLVTPNYNPDSSVQPLGWTRFTQGFDWSDLGQGAMPALNSPILENRGDTATATSSMLQIVGRGDGIGGVNASSSSVAFFDNIRMVNVDTGDIAFNWTFENGQLPEFLGSHHTVELTVVPRAYAYETDAGFEPRYWPMDTPSIVDTFRDRIPQIGNVWASNWRFPPMNYQNTEDFFLRNFNTVTAEDYHKPDQIAPTRRTINQANFDRGVGIARWAAEHDMYMIGHALVWHAQTPYWMTRTAQGANADLVSREEAKENMRWLAENWAGALENDPTVDIHAWDVVNEAFVSYVSVDAWNANPNWRHHLRRIGDTAGEMVAVAGDAQWYGAFANNEEGLPGYDYIFYAFKFARRYAPSSILYYNDYNEERPGKAMAIADMVSEMNARWEAHPDYDGRQLIDGIGMQSHHHIVGWRTNFDAIPWAIRLFYSVTGRVSLTELDITLGGQGSRALTAAEYATWTVADLIREIPSTEAQVGHHPHDWTMSELHAHYYGRVMGYYLDAADYITRLSIWGTTDEGSWRANGRPLLFDGRFNPKAAFEAFITATPLNSSWQAPDLVTPDDFGTYRPHQDQVSLALDALEARVETSLLREEDNYTPESWNVFAEALAHAKDVLGQFGVELDLGIVAAFAVNHEADLALIQAAYDSLYEAYRNLEEAPVLVEAIPTAFVNRLNGNQNELVITVTEVFDNGETNEITEHFMIRNNASGTFEVGDYRVFVNTQGNTQIREIRIVE